MNVSKRKNFQQYQKNKMLKLSRNSVPINVYPVPEYGLLGWVIGTFYDYMSFTESPVAHCPCVSSRKLVKCSIHNHYAKTFFVTDFQ